jgi:hypothetical protein
VSSIIGTLARLGLASVCSLCARVAWAIENSGLNASPEGLALTPLFQQPGILPAPSSPCHALVSPPPRCNGLESPFPMPRPRPARREPAAAAVARRSKRRFAAWLVDSILARFELVSTRFLCLRCHACTCSYDVPRREFAFLVQTAGANHRWTSQLG